MATADELFEIGNWAAARDAYLSELDVAATARAHDGLAKSHRAMGETATAAKAWEQAYRLHVRDGDASSAARVATEIAEVVLESTGDAAVAKGWLERARHHLQDLPDDQGLVMLAAMQAYVALTYDKDPNRARTFGVEALEQARRVGDDSAEIAAKAHLGLVMVMAGDMVEGMCLLDEVTAAALGGELSTEEALDTYCILITACERVRDHARVLQWARHVIDTADDLGADGFAAFARTEYANVLVQTGAWEEAERQLRQVIDDPDARPVGTAMAYVFLADLLRCRGDLDGADAALRIAEQEPRRAVRHMVMASRADLLLATGNAQDAADLARRYLRSVSAEARAERVGALETLTSAGLLVGDRSGATAAAEELRTIAVSIPTAGVRAAAATCTALVLADEGDLDEALEGFLTALELYDEADMAPDVIATRVELARVHVARGEVERATNQAERARHDAGVLGARRTAAAAGDILAGLRSVADGGPAGLTGREVEVLGLVAGGASNQEIAASMVLSIRTVERHLSNIYLKIGATGPSARALATSYAHRHSLT